MRYFLKYKRLLANFGTLLLVACQAPPVIAPNDRTASAYELVPDMMEHIRSLVQLSGISPPVASRVYAYAGITLHESWARTTAGKTFVGHLNGLSALPTPDTTQALIPEQVAEQALSQVAIALFPNPTPQVEALIRQIPSGNTDRESSPSARYGQTLGQALVAWVEKDQYQQIQQLTYKAPTTSHKQGGWLPTAAQKPTEPFWGSLRTFAVENANACHSPPSMAFSTEANSPFYNQAKEVLDVSNTLTAEQKAIAQWWADGPIQTATPPGHWVSLAGQILQQQKKEAPEAAKVYALLGVAMADAFIVCWETKYKVNLLRPIDYIHTALQQPNWQPLIATPPFPEYPSGHSVGSGAAAAILTHLLGDTPFVDRTNQHLGQPARTFASFNAAAQEAAISRLYGGIHFRDAIELGLQQGQCVGNQVLKQLP